MLMNLNPPGLVPVHPTANQPLSTFLSGNPDLGNGPAETGHCGEEAKELEERLGRHSPSSKHLTLGPADGEMCLPPGFMDQREQHSSEGVWALLLKVFCLFLQPFFLLSPKSCTFLAVKSPGSLSPALSVNQNQHKGEFLQNGCAE